MTLYDVRIPGLKMTVVAADGQPVQPVSVDEFRIATAETYDVIVTPTAARYQIEAESIDRNGFAVASLQNESNPQKQAMVMPMARPRAVFSMEDMPHGNMGTNRSHDQQPQGQNQPQPLQQQQQPQQQTGQMRMGQSLGMGVQPRQAQAMQSQGMQGQGMQGQGMMGHRMQGQGMQGQAMQGQAMQGQGMQGQGMQGQGMMGHRMQSQGVMGHRMQDQNMQAQGMQDQENNTQVLGWANASTPQGHKALHYSDLKALIAQKDLRPVEKELLVRLGGGMGSYTWTINGKTFDQMQPLHVNYNDRVRIRFVNNTMMPHPMHLHGMFMQLENGQQAQDLPNKHTLLVPPGKSISALLTADEVGEWAIHCHLLYHMSAGMMTKLVVAKVDPQTSKAF